MDYIAVEQAIERAGLRLVLTAGVPGPWGEAAKGVLRVKKIPYTAVRQDAGQVSEALLAWTRQTSAPVAMYERERPRAGWAEILFLAERLEPSPPLVPSDAAERALMLGLCHEICGEQGLGWSRRLMLMGAADASERDSMPWKYGADDAASVERAARRVAEILALLASRLAAQRAAGRRFFMGDSLSALDIYWATFSNLVAPLPAEKSPMPDFVRSVYEFSGEVDPALLEHRDRVFEEYLGLPQAF